MSIHLYKHNEDAYRAVETMLEEKQMAAVIHPTGTGKSMIAFKLVEQHPHKHFLWLSPSEYIYKTQLENIDTQFSNIEYMSYSRLMKHEDSIDTLRPDYIILDELWSNLEESLGKLNYSIFLNPDIIDMWLDNFGVYNPDAQAADFFAAVETAIAPTFEIPRELKQRFKKWIKTLVVQSDDRPFSMLHGDYKVLSFNYTEFIETLYGAKSNNVCYIHGCRKNRNNGKPSELILGHRPGMEDEQWDKVRLKPFKFKDPYKRYIMESALETAAREAAWYEEETTKKCSDIIKKHRSFFEELTTIKYIFVIGHSLSEVDYPYFEEICKKTNAKWYIGYHSLDDLKRLLSFVDKMNLREIMVFRS